MPKRTYLPFSDDKAEKQRKLSTLSTCVLSRDTSDIDKINRLIALPTLGKSVGIIVNANTYETEKHRFLELEFVPGFKSTDIFIESRYVGCEDLSLAYQGLDPLRKQWLKVSWRTWSERQIACFSNGQVSFAPACSVCLKPFEQTKATYIAIELLDKDLWPGKEIVASDCIKQLLKVINYAYEQENKKVILVNNTKFSQQMLVEKIKEQIPKEEKEKILDRIQALGLMQSEKLFIKTALQDFQFLPGVADIVLDYVMPACRLPH